MGNGVLPNGPSYRAHPRLYLSAISLLRSDSVAFECEADMRTVDRSNQSDVNVESREGISPPRAPR
jgi:hypothetical protein